MAEEIEEKNKAMEIDPKDTNDDSNQQKNDVSDKDLTNPRDKEVDNQPDNNNNVVNNDANSS